MKLELVNFKRRVSDVLYFVKIEIETEAEMKMANENGTDEVFGIFDIYI